MTFKQLRLSFTDVTTFITWQSRQLFHKDVMRHSKTLSNIITGAFVAALITSAPLQAQDWRFGGQLSLANPSGDLSEGSKMGFGLAVFAEQGLNNKMALRYNVSYSLFGAKKIEDGAVETSANAVSIIGDFLYRFDSHDKGCFVFAGIGYLMPKSEWEDKGWSESGSTSISGFGLSAGIGYNFTRNFGAEARYVKSFGVKVDEFNEKIDFAADWFTVSVSYRF